MGYLTRFKLTWEAPIPAEITDERARAKARAERDGQIVAVLEQTEWWSSIEDGEAQKWYSRHTDIREVAMQFPDVVFTLQGHGENATDMWRTYFQADFCYTVKAVITYPEFDPDKLELNYGKA